MRFLMILCLVSACFASCSKNKEDVWTYTYTSDHFIVESGFDRGEGIIGGYSIAHEQNAQLWFKSNIQYAGGAYAPESDLYFVTIKKNEEYVFSGYLEDLTPGDTLKYTYKIKLQ